VGRPSRGDCGQAVDLGGVDGAPWFKGCPRWSTNVPFEMSLSTSRLVPRLGVSGGVLVADRDIPNVSGDVDVC
jgi:hypothetical protein